MAMNIGPWSPPTQWGHTPNDAYSPAAYHQQMPSELPPLPDYSCTLVAYSQQASDGGYYYLPPANMDVGGMSQQEMYNWVADPEVAQGIPEGRFCRKCSLCNLL